MALGNLRNSTTDTAWKGMNRITYALVASIINCYHSLSSRVRILLKFCSVQSQHDSISLVNNSQYYLIEGTSEGKTDGKSSLIFVVICRLNRQPSPLQTRTFRPLEKARSARAPSIQVGKSLL